MNPQLDKTSGLGLPQPGNDMSQLPPIHAPQTFHAPENAIPQFSVGAPQLPSVPPAITAPIASPAIAAAPQPAVNPMQAGPTTLNDPIAKANAQFASNSALAASQADDADTPFDEEWVEKAKDVVGRTHGDPFAQSKELSKLKAQYIKTRYNKDIKVSED